MAAAGGTLPAQSFMLPSAKGTVIGHDQVLAVVEDKTITNEELMMAIAPLIPQTRSSSRTDEEFNQRIEKMRREMLQSMVDKVLIVKEFNDKGMMIPQSVFDGAFEEDFKKRFNGDRSEFIKYLQSQNKTIKQYRKELEENIIAYQMQMMQQKMTLSEVSPVHITNYYEANKKQWYTPGNVEISQISVSGSGPEDAREKAAKILDEIKGGMKFEDAAKKYSADSNASNGGRWGWYKKGALNLPIDKAAFELEIGKVSDPIVIGNYAYIIRVEDRRPEGILPLDDVREAIERKLADENAMFEYHKWLKRLREKAYIRYY